MFHRAMHERHGSGSRQMKRLVRGRTGQAEVAACRAEQIVRRSEDRGDDRRHGREVDEHLPLGPVQHAARCARGAERVPVRTTVAASVGVERDDVGGNFSNPSAEEGGVVSVEGIENDHEAVAVEDPHRVLDL